MVFHFVCLAYVLYVICSPLRDLSIDDLPAPDLKKLSSEDMNKAGSRRHQRSMSSEEASEAMLDTIAAQQSARQVPTFLSLLLSSYVVHSLLLSLCSSKSASWSSLYKLPSVSADDSGQVQSLEDAVSVYVCACV